MSLDERIGSITERTGGEPEISHFHAILDAELEQAETGIDPSDAAVLQEYLTRLRDLHDAVVAMEFYEKRLGEP